MYLVCDNNMIIKFGHIANIICTHGVSLSYEPGYKKMFKNIVKSKKIKDALNKDDFLITVIGRTYDEKRLDLYSVWDVESNKYIIVQKKKKKKKTKYQIIINLKFLKKKIYLTFDSYKLSFNLIFLSFIHHNIINSIYTNF